MDIFRIHGTLKHDPAIDAWLAGEPADLRAIAKWWFTRMRQCGDDVRELMHDGCPVACVEDAPFAYVNTYTRHVNVGFFHGAALPAPAGMLAGGGKRMRHVKLTAAGEPNAIALESLIEAAYRDIRSRLGRR